jgi:hypothetical protein
VQPPSYLKFADIFLFDVLITTQTLPPSGLTKAQVYKSLLCLVVATLTAPRFTYFEK